MLKITTIALLSSTPQSALIVGSRLITSFDFLWMASTCYFIFQFICFLKEFTRVINWIFFHHIHEWINSYYFFFESHDFNPFWWNFIVNFRSIKITEVFIYWVYPRRETEAIAQQQFVMKFHKSKRISEKKVNLSQHFWNLTSSNDIGNDLHIFFSSRFDRLLLHIHSYDIMGE